MHSVLKQTCWCSRRCSCWNWRWGGWCWKEHTNCHLGQTFSTPTPTALSLPSNSKPNLRRNRLRWHVALQRRIRKLYLLRTETAKHTAYFHVRHSFTAEQRERHHTKSALALALALAHTHSHSHSRIDNEEKHTVALNRENLICIVVVCLPLVVVVAVVEVVVTVGVVVDVVAANCKYKRWPLDETFASLKRVDVDVNLFVTITSVW